MAIEFAEIGRLPVPEDNVAIATKVLAAGTEINYQGRILTLSHGILVGHRFAIQDIAIGEALLSWGQTFGLAIKPIVPGDYVCNGDVLKELGRRSLDFELPAEPNFRNDLETYTFDEANFIPAEALPRHEEMAYFEGYLRPGQRGVGTRNMIVLLGTGSLTSGFVRRLERELQSNVSDYPNVDGIVAVAHTEGAQKNINNQELLLRTLAGFMVHPNVGAVLAVDYGYAGISNEMLRDYMQAHDYPLSDVTHEFKSLSQSFENDLSGAIATVNNWLPIVNEVERSPQPLSELKIALQCGGSDAFSGVSGNPLASWVAKEVIRYGGAANLAETDELIGAETYVLDKVRDAAVARKFLSFVERFKERVGWHGHSAEGNPSGGNKYRGLYNIYLKSLGAATKRHPDVPLDAVIDYSEPMPESGFYFMDSPGNDLESIAGQVAAGCNMIFFVTGNGSITNFPFVPTIKIVTTTDRYNFLATDMDVNAGAYLDGTPLDELGAETLDLTVEVASGQRSIGEKAGHAQVQIWRDWQLTEATNIELLAKVEYSGEPIQINTDIAVPDVSISAYKKGDIATTEQVGLILPTSLCSGQIAKMCVERLNQQIDNYDVSRFVTLVHTEGCGGSINTEFKDTLLGYLSHPFVKHALLLEHGCEATHNDYFRIAMRERGYDPANYGWASIQLDGGIETVIQKMMTWFAAARDRTKATEQTQSGLKAATVALISQGEISAETTTAFATVCRMIIAAGGTVLVHQNDALLIGDFAAQLEIPSTPEPTLAYADVAQKPGCHVMAMPTRDWGEILTGMGASGVELIISHIDKQPLPGHPMIPVLQIAEQGDLAAEFETSLDLLLDGNVEERVNILLEHIVQTLSHTYTPAVVASGNVYFQVTRGLLGVSL